MNPDRLSFSKTLIGVGAVLVLAPLLLFAYLSNKHQDRVLEIVKDKGTAVALPDELRRHGGNDVLFFFAGAGSFGVGALLTALGLWGARGVFLKQPLNAIADGESAAGEPLAATSSFTS